MANDAAYADLLDSLSPLSSAGIDLDEARLNPRAAMVKLGLGQDTPPQPWLQAQNDAPPEPGLSPNGNALPPGLKTRTPVPTAPASVPGSVTPSGTPDQKRGRQTYTDRPNAPAASAVGSVEELQRQNAGTIALGQQNYAKASTDVDTEAAQPSLAEATRQLEEQRANYAIPANPNQAQYKPSFSQRFMRGIDGFAKAGVFGVVDPKLGGAKPYGAPNAQYDYEEGQRQARVASVDQRLQQAKANYDAAAARNKQVTEDRAKLVTILPDATNPSISQQRVPIEQQNADSTAQTAFNNSPEAKQQISEQTMTEHQKQADALHLTGQTRTVFLLNGKIPDPRQATAEEIARNQAMAAWHRDNPGQNPGLDDIRSINAAVSGSEIKNPGRTGKPISPALQNKILDEKNSAMAKATANYRAGKLPDKLTDYTQQDWQADMQAAQDKFEASIEAESGTVDHMTINPDGSWTAASGRKAPSSAHATPASYTPPPVPKEQLREGRTGTDPRTGQRVVVQRNSKTGQLELVPVKGGA